MINNFQQVLVEPVPDAVPGLSFTVTPPEECRVYVLLHQCTKHKTAFDYFTRHLYNV